MGAIRLRTTGDCAKHGLDIGIECCVCGRFVVFTVQSFGSTLGRSLQMLASPLKCSNCGSRMHHVRPWDQCNRPAKLKPQRTPLVPLYVAKPGRRQRAKG